MGTLWDADPVYIVKHDKVQPLEVVIKAMRCCHGKPPRMTTNPNCNGCPYRKIYSSACSRHMVWDASWWLEQLGPGQMRMEF